MKTTRDLVHALLNMQDVEEGTGLCASPKLVIYGEEMAEYTIESFYLRDDNRAVMNIARSIGK